MRHGLAVDRHDPKVKSDDARHLVKRGREDVALMARLLERLGVRPDVVLSSPYLRARQTAEIVAERLGVEERVSISDELSPGGAPYGVLNDILSHGRPAQSLLCGHMPGLGMLIGYLTWSQPDIGISLRTSQICRVDLSDTASYPGSADVRWLIAPKVARQLIDDQHGP